MGPKLRTALEVVLLASGYWLLAKLGYIFLFRPETSATIWPPSGLTLAFLLRSSPRKWPVFLTVIFLTEASISRAHGWPLDVSVAWGIADTIEPLLGALFIRKVTGPDFNVLRLKDVGALILAAMITPFPGAVLATVASSYWINAAPYWNNLQAWWLAISLGEVLIAPFILVWLGGLGNLRKKGHLGEGALLIFLDVAICAGIFSSDISWIHTGFIRSYLIFPVSIWAVLRFEEYGATATMLILNAISAYYTAAGKGPFAVISSSPLDRMIALQAYLSFANISSLVVAAALVERRQHISGLQRSISLLDSTLEATADGIVASGNDGRIEVYNQNFVKMWRFPKGLIDTRSVEKTIDFAATMLKEPERYREILRKTVSQPDVPMKDLLEMKDGRVLERTSRARRSQGKLTGRVVSFRDVTEQIRATAEAKELSERLSRVLGSVSDFLWSVTIDPTGKYSLIYFSPVVEKLTGRRLEYFLGGPDKWFTIVHPDDFPNFRARWEKVVKGNSKQNELEYRIVLPDGTIRWIHDSSVIERLDGGELRLSGVTADITHRKLYEESRERLLTEETRARQAAEDAVLLRDDFLSIAAHELRTPLTPIRMNLQLIKRQVEMTDCDFPKIEYLRKAIEGADREFGHFLDLVENLLDVSRIRAGRLILDRREFNLGELARRVVERFAPQFAKARCPVRQDIDDSVVGLWDQSRIEQVLINLLSNAMKYGAKHPIDVSVYRQKDKAFIRVKDRGIGIKKEDQERIFRRFERVAPIKHFGGFGLGLFITQEIVEAHGGVIRVESEHGTGSAFTVELPVK